MMMILIRTYTGGYHADTHADVMYVTVSVSDFVADAKNPSVYTRNYYHHMYL
ncbi:MAG: hypothetical protein ACLTAT_11045 [Lachnospira eligens]